MAKCFQTGISLKYYNFFCLVDNFVPFENTPFLQNEDIGQTNIILQSTEGIPLAGILYHDIFVSISLLPCTLFQVGLTN